MNQDNKYDIEQAHVDVPTYQYPSVVYIQDLLYVVASKIDGKEVSLLKVLDYIIIELEIIKSAYYGYDKNLFTKLKVTLEVLMSSNELLNSNKNEIFDCLELLSFLSNDRKNLDFLPIKYQTDEATSQRFEGERRTLIRNKLRNSNLICPSCKNEFDQFRYDAIRTPFNITCSKCHHSFPND